MNMTPLSSRWTEFIGRLEGEGGCNFRRKEDGNIVWNCDGTFKHTVDILEDMGYDPYGSMTYFRSHGAYCDCEILFNVT